MADFGISKRAEEANGPSTRQGTEEYMAPELRGLNAKTEGDHVIDFKAGDMWSIGEIGFRLLTGECTFQRLNDLME